MKKILLCTVLAASTLLGACGSDDSKAKESSNNFKLGIVTNANGVDDKSFNQATWEGIKKFGEENGLKEGEGYRYLVSATEAEYLPNLTKFAEGNFDLTLGVAYLFDDAIATVAKQFPNNNFAIIDSVVEADNVASITFKENEGSFLAGVVAGLATKTNKVGFVGGVKTELIEKFEYGFRAGVEAVNPKAEVFVEYAQAFDKPEVGAQIASTMYSQKADILFQAAGGSGNGVFTEAKNRAKKGEKVWVIGVDRDQHQEGMPENVTLTSMIKHLDVAVGDLAKQTLDGKFPGGKVVSLGVADKAVTLSDNTDNVNKVNADILKTVKEYETKISNGDIKVPSTKAEYDTFK